MRLKASSEPSKNASRFARTLVSLAVLICLAAWSPKLTAAEDAIKGLSFLDAPAEVDREVLRTAVRAQIVEGLKYLENWRDYHTLPLHKAIGIYYSVHADVWWSGKQSLNLYVSRWRGSWGHGSAEEARNSLFKNCPDCLLVLLDDKVLGLDKIVDEFIFEQKESLARLRDLNSRAQQTPLMADVARRMAGAGVSKYAPAPILPLAIGYPDNQQDYQSVCQNRIFYTLRSIAIPDRAVAISRLNQMAGLGLYGAYQRAVSTPSNPQTDFRNPSLDQRATRQMSFISVQRDSQNIAPLPLNLARDLSGERIVMIWAEGSVRTTRDGIPLDVDPLLRPVAIQTDRDLYEGIEVRLPDRGGGCTVTMPFGGRATIRFGLRPGDRAAANALLSSLIANVAAALKSSPLLSSPVENEPFAPGEFAMIRLNLPSQVLGGSYFERSTYMVNTWIAATNNPIGSLYGRELFQGVGEHSLHDGPNLQLFLKVKHDLTRATHRLGDYRDPTPSERERYDLVIRSRVQAAVALTCKRFGGQISQETCVISLVREPK